MINEGQVMALAADAMPTQRRITEAALTLFAAKGYAATGIRQIANSAGVSSAALYHYTGTKHGLLVNIMTEGLRRFAAASRQAVADLTGSERHIVALTRVHVATEALMPRLAMVIDGEVRSLNSDDGAVVALRDDYESVWAHAIDLGAEAGVFYVTEPRLARLALLEMCNGVARWFSPQGRLSLEAVADHFADMALAMLNSRRSRAAELVTTASLDMRPPNYEIDLVRRIFADLHSPELPRAIA